MMGKRGKGLMGLSAATTEKVKDTVTDAVLSVGAGAMGAGIGAIAGRWSLVLSVPFIAYGAYKKSLPVMAGGIAMAASNVKLGGSATNGVGGIKEFSEGAKERVKVYFDNFKDKLFLPSKKAPVAGLGNTSAYFTNPYQPSMGEIDLSPLDRIQNQISQMTGTEELEDIEREF